MTDLVALQIERRGNVVIAQVAGELDISEAPAVGKRIAEALERTASGVVVDLTPLSFIDSSGVSMLFSLSRRVASHRQELRVVAPPSGPVARVLDMVGFRRAAPVHEELAAAVESIG